MNSYRWSSGGVTIRSISGRLSRPGREPALVMIGGWKSIVDYWGGEMPLNEDGVLITQDVADYNEAGAPNGILTTACASDETWGNSTMRSRITTMVDACQSTGYFPEGRVHLFGVSMGSLCCLLWAINNPDRVQSMCLTLAPFDLQSIYDRDPLGIGIRASISAAYGGRPPDNENPLLRVDELVGIPIKAFYSTNDWATPLSETEEFLSVSEATGVNMGAVGHTWGDYSVFNGNVLGDFIVEHSNDIFTPPVNKKGISVGGPFSEQSTATQDDDLDDIAGLDAGWVRIDINWAVVQAGGSSSYNWYCDHAIEGALSRGLKVLATIVYTPWWHKADPHMYPLAETFAAFCTKAAQRYSPQGVSHWEIWNEPNITGGFLAPNATNYFNTCLKPGYNAINEVDRFAMVMHGGLANSADSAPDMDPLTYLTALYNVSTAKNFFDAVNMHPYTQPSVPGGGESWNPWTKMVNMRALMVARGDADKKVWITESGAATDGDPAHAETFTTEAQQANIVRLGFSVGASLGWVGPIFTYMHRDKTDQPGSSTHTREDFFGLEDFDRNEKPAADEFRSANGDW